MHSISAMLVSGLCPTSFRPILRRPMADDGLLTFGNRSSFKINISLSTRGYLDQWKEWMEFADDGGCPPRWFSPLESGSRPTAGSPLLLFLPGIDGSGLGLLLHYQKLGEIFDIWCLHIPALELTPLPGLVELVQNTVKVEQQHSGKRPIYLVGESLGASLALVLAAKNPDIDFLLILANPANPWCRALFHYRICSLINQMLDCISGQAQYRYQDDKFDLVAAIKCAGYYRRGASADYFTDFLPPTPSELKSVCEAFRWMDEAVDLVMLSTVNGKVVRGLAGIPLEGPVLLVSNHMMLGLDIVPLLSRFWLEQNIKLRTIAHPAFFERMMMDGKMQDLPQCDVVRMTGGVPSANNLYRLLKSKSHVLLYPGGLREVLHRRGEEHKLIWPVEPEFVRVAARFGAQIVPFGTIGEDDALQLLLDCDDQMKIPQLKALIEYLTSEAPRVRSRSDVEGEIGKQVVYCPVALPKLPGRFYFFFGEPISTQGRKDVSTNKGKARELYLEVKRETDKCIDYLKDRRENDPYRNLLVCLAYQSYHGSESQVPTFEI